MGELEFFRVYDVLLGKRKCKGIYLGEFEFRNDLSKRILLDIPISVKKKNFFQVRKFDKYEFKEGVLYFGKNYHVKIPENQEIYYKEILEEKLNIKFPKD